MFAKLKQKIAEEESSTESPRPRSSTPSARRQKVNGFSENKWEKRRLSNASSLYGSRESVASSISGYSSGINASRRNSFRTASATPIGTPVDSPSRSINNRSSRDEILAALARREDQITKLESKIADMANLVREQARTKDSLEEALERQREDHNRTMRGITQESEERIARIKSEYEKSLDEKDEELKSKLKALSMGDCRNADMSELNKLQQQEIMKLKSLFIQFQTDATRKAAEILEKSKQLEDLDKAYTDQRGELSSLQERLDDLARERTKYEMRGRQQQQIIDSVEKEKNSLRDELNNTVSELAQKTLQLGRVEKSLNHAEDELATVRQSYSLFKNKTTTELEEKDGQVSRLKERTNDLEQRLEASKLSGNDQFQALEKERELLEGRLKETRDLLADVKSNSNDRINTLGSLVSTLNERLERKGNELSDCQKKSVEEKSSLQVKVKSLEERLANTNQLISDTKNSDTGKIQALRDQNVYLEKELENVQQQLSEQRRFSEQQISNLETQIQRLEDVRDREKNELQEKLDQLKAFENEYSGHEDDLKQQLADLEEEKEQLQNELMVKAEEYEHMALCLEDAMKETNELKSQIAIFEQTLKQKDGGKTENTSLRLNSDLRLELRTELENTKVRYEKAERVVQEREDTIAELRRILKEKDTELSRSSTKLKQYEENNRFVQHDRIHPSGGRDTYRIFTGLRQQVKDLEQQLKEREMLQLDENELRELRETNVQLETVLEDKEKKIKLLQLKLAELKKAFQRELKIPAPGNDVHDARTPSSCSSDGSVPLEQDRDRLDYLEVNFKYLKHVVLKYMCCSNKQSRQLIRVIAHLLQFTSKECAAVEEAVEWKLPLDT